MLSIGIWLFHANNIFIVGNFGGVLIWRIGKFGHLGVLNLVLRRLKIIA